MNFKESKYNFFLPHNGDKIIAFNARTSALALMPLADYEKYQSFLTNTAEIDDNFTEQLLYGGYILPTEVDELDLIRARMWDAKKKYQGLGITIAPTLQCNFKCPYCYETGAVLAGKMSTKVQQEVITFITSQAQNIKFLNLYWYGGEPLMAFDIIQNLSKEIIKLTTEREILYEANIITNGYLLTQDVIDKFQELQIKSIQITLDGPAHTHDKRRILKDGSPTFYRILENIKKVVEKDIAIALRVNVDIDNLDSCEEIIKLIESYGLKDKVTLYFAYVESTDNCLNQEKCLSIKNFSKHNLELKKKLIELECKNAIGYPFFKSNFCGADIDNNYVIDPLGYIYKCWSDIGFHKQAVNQLGETISVLQKYKYQNNNLKYLLYDPTQDEKCKECSFLPICMGGCPHTRTAKSKNCSEIIYNLEEIIKTIVQHKLYENFS